MEKTTSCWGGGEKIRKQMSFDLFVWGVRWDCCTYQKICLIYPLDVSRSFA
jgi:hypothetical protein